MKSLRQSLHRRAQERLLQAAREQKSTAPLRLVFAEPPVFHGLYWGKARGGPFHAFRPIQEFLRLREAWFMLGITWESGNLTESAKLKAFVEENRARYPRHHFIFLTNTPEEQGWFTAAGLSSIFCNHNAFADERIFRPLPGAEKSADAIYNARLNSVKRHELAADVQSLALIAYTLEDFPEPAYAESVRQRFGHARWCNAERLLTAEEVNGELNTARVGLALSAVEGAMFASVEYLLAGLPVVSTRSLGGRGVFFDGENSAIVDDTPAAVAAGVRHFLHNPVDGGLNRSRTLERMWEHRDRYIALADGISRLGGRPHSLRDKWEKYFKHRMVSDNERVDQVLRKLARAEGWLPE